jgi:hypothetical protein
MDKKIKQLIAEKNISYETLLKLLESYSPDASDEEEGDADDTEESEPQTDSNESENAEGEAASKEQPKKTQKMESTELDLEKRIEALFEKKMKEFEKKASKKPAPKPTNPNVIRKLAKGGVEKGEFGIIP